MGLQPLGVPLDGQAEGVTMQLNRLGDAVGGQGGGAQIRRYLAHTLVVQTVHFHLGLTEDLSQVAAGGHLHGVDKLVTRVAGEVVVLEGAGVLVEDIFVQGAAKGDVDHLEAAADAQEGHAILGGFYDQVQLQAVAVGVDVIDLGVRLPTVAGGVDIPAASKAAGHGA